MSVIGFVGVGAADSASGPTSLTPTLHASTAVDDCVILLVYARKATGATITLPVGYTQIAAWEGVGGTFAIGHRIHESGDDTTPTVTLSGLTSGTSGDDALAQAATFRGTDLVNPIHVVGTPLTDGGTASEHPGPMPSITTTAPDALLIALFGRFNNWLPANIFPPPGMAEIAQVDSEAGLDAGMGWAFEFRGEAGATGDKTFVKDTTAAAEHGGILFALASAGGGVQVAATKDQAITKMRQVTAKLREAARRHRQGVDPLEALWTPDGSSSTGILQVLRGKVTEIPIEVAGEGAGWFQNLPLFTVELECLPLMLDADEIVGPTVNVTTPIGSLEVPNVPGDGSALTRLLFTDTATQARALGEWGLEADDYVAGAILIDSDSMSVTGLAGAGATRTGAYDPDAAGNNVIRATLASTPVAVCATPGLTRIGRYRPRMRLFASTDDVYVRLAYKTGDGPWQRTRPWVRASIANQWLEPPFPEVVAGRVTQGQQRFDVRIEAYAETPGATLDVDFLSLVPSSHAYGVARAPAVDSAAAETYAARDEFDQTAGALTGKTLAVGGTWAAIAGSDADDFTVNATDDVAERTAVSDADLNTGRYVSAGSTSYAAISLAVDVEIPLEGVALSNHLRSGAFARLTDVNNWLLVVAEADVDGGAGRIYLRVYKRVAGTVTQLASVTIADVVVEVTRFSLELAADALGGWSARGWKTTGARPETPTASGFDADLLAGGALATGKIGLYDAYTSATANTRTYDNFAAFASTLDFACHSGRSIEFRHDATERENAAGTAWGPPPLYRGSRVHLRPAGAAGVVNRLGFVARRTDVDDGLPSSGVTDGYSVDVFYRPRYLELPG